MQILVRIADPISLQALIDALAARDIAFRVDNSGMHALLPLPDVMDMRVFVADGDFDAARQVMLDLGLGKSA